MSVMDEMSQSAIWPYFSMAAALSLLNAVTATFSEVLSVKTFVTRRRRRVGGAGGWVASSTGSQCGGQATPFSVSPRLTGKHHQV